MRRHLLSFALALVALPAAAQYVIDDGTAEQDGPTPGNPSDILWTNSFVAVAGANTIKQVLGQFQGVFIGRATAYLWADADNNSIPDIGGVLSSGGFIGTVPAWFVYDIPDVTLAVGQSFIVGFHVRTVGAPQEFVGRIDTTTPTFANRSWWAWDGDPINPNNWSGANPSFLDALPATWHGNWMIRASSIAVPEPATAIAIAAGIAAMAIKRRRR